MISLPKNRHPLLNKVEVPLECFWTNVHEGVKDKANTFFAYRV